MISRWNLDVNDAQRRQTFDAGALKQEFPGLANPRLHYLDNAATAQMPEIVLAALRSFEVDAR